MRTLFKSILIKCEDNHNIKGDGSSVRETAIQQVHLAIMFPRSVFLLLCHAWLGSSLIFENNGFKEVAVVLHSRDDPESWINNMEVLSRTFFFGLLSNVFIPQAAASVTSFLSLQDPFKQASQVIFNATWYNTFFDQINVFADPSLNDLRGEYERAPFPRDVQIFFTNLR